MGLIFPSEFVLFSALQILMSTQSAEDLAKMQILEEWSLKICISKRIPFLFLFLFFFFSFFAFYGHTCSIWRFPGQRSNRSYSLRLTPQP